MNAAYQLPFRISPTTVDFGVLVPGVAEDRTIKLTNLTEETLAFQIEMIPPWLSVSMGTASGNDSMINLRVDTNSLSCSGSQAAELKISAKGHTVRLKVHVALRSQKNVRRSRNAASKDTQGTGSSSASTNRPHTRGTRLSISLLLSAGLLCLLYGSIYSVVTTLPMGSFGEQYLMGTVTGVLVAAYIIMSFGQAFPASNRIVTPASSSPQHQRLLAAVTAVCDRFGIAPVNTVLRSDPKPNLRSCGIGPGLACLYVNRGLLDVLQDRGQLEGAVAHEIAHVVRFDTFFFSSIGPPLWIFRHVLSAVRKLASGAGKSGRGINLSPLVFLMLLRPGPGCLPALCVLLVLLMFGVMLVLAMFYAALVLLGLLALAAICQFYSRHVEREADALAAQVVGDCDPIVAALAACIDYYPAEVAAMTAFASENFDGSTKLTGRSILSALKAGAPAACRSDFRARLLRSHPFVLERIAALINRFGTQIV